MRQDRPRPGMVSESSVGRVAAIINRYRWMVASAGAKPYALATSRRLIAVFLELIQHDALVGISSGVCAYVQILFLYKLFLLFDRIWVNARDSHLVRLERFFI